MRGVGCVRGATSPDARDVASMQMSHPLVPLMSFPVWLPGAVTARGASGDGWCLGHLQFGARAVRRVGGLGCGCLCVCVTHWHVHSNQKHRTTTNKCLDPSLMKVFYFFILVDHGF